MNISVRFILLIIGFVLLESCSATTATKITGSWKDPEAKNYKDYFVAVLNKKLPVRSTLGKDISRRLKKEGLRQRRALVFSRIRKK